MPSTLEARCREERDLSEVLAKDKLDQVLSLLAPSGCGRSVVVKVAGAEPYW